jgi:DNA-binding transcriptional LysR family regulator
MLDDILLFVQLVNIGNYSQTANKFHISQPTLSRKIAQLEQELGVQLIKRNTRNFEITTAGNKLYHGFSDQVDHYNKVINSLKREGESINGKLNVSLPTALSVYAIAPYVGEFMQKNPGIELNIAYQNREIDLVREKFDLAITSEIPKQQTTKIRLLYAVPLYIYCTPEYIERYGLPKSIHDCIATHLAAGSLKESRTPERDYFLHHKNGEELHLVGSSRLNVSNSMHGKYMALSGHVIAGGWDALYAEELKSGQLIKIYPEYSWGMLSFYLVRLANSESALVNLFIEFIEECFARLKTPVTE